MTVKGKKTGTGSIRERGNGLFELRIYYAEKDGARKRKSFYGHSEEVCYERATDSLMNKK